MRLKKVFLWLAIVLIVLVLAVKLGENYVIKHYSNRAIPIKNKVVIKIGKINLSLLKGGIVLNDIQLLDTLSPVATGSVRSVTVSGIRWFRLITGGGFSMRTLKAEGAVCELKLNRLKADTSTTASLDTIDQILTFSAPVLNVRFDSEMRPELHKLDVRKIQFRPGKGSYNVDVAKIHATHGLRQIELDSFRLIPRYPKLEFGYKAGRRLSSIDILIEKINLREFDLQALTHDSTLAIQSITCERGYVNVFSDKRLPIDMDRYGSLPHEALLNASTRIAIDSVIVKNIAVQYASLNPNTMEEGYLDFKRSYVSIYNITNVPQRIEKNSSMTVDLHSSFTSEGELNAHFDFALNRNDYRIKWHGSLGKMKLGNLDSFVLPIVNMHIVGGYCQGLKFEVVSDYDTSRGTLEFQYTDLRIMAMDLEGKKEMKFLSSMANTFVVHSHNLVGDKNFYRGKINVARRKYKGFPDYVWTSLENGILYTILPDGIAKSVEKQPDKAKQKELKKSKKETSKEKRKENRLQKKKSG